MNEATLKGALVKTIREHIPSAKVFRHEDHFTAGIPDISVTFNGKTSWWEVKFANPSFASTGIQELTMKQLAYSGIAYYLIYGIDAEHTKTVHIVEPKNISQWANNSQSTGGFDHHWVVEQMRGIHAA